MRRTLSGIHVSADESLSKQTWPNNLSTSAEVIILHERRDDFRETWHVREWFRFQDFLGRDISDKVGVIFIFEEMHRRDALAGILNLARS
jgi:hypothetical protein